MDSEYIDREVFIRDKRAQYCADCRKRKGMKNGKERFIYDVGDAPCRSCGIDDMISGLEDYPTADVRENVRGEWINDNTACGLYKCSVCNDFATVIGWASCVPIEQMYRIMKYCPNCGAEMRGES